MRRPDHHTARSDGAYPDLAVVRPASDPDLPRYAQFYVDCTGRLVDRRAHHTGGTMNAPAPPPPQPATEPTGRLSHDLYGRLHNWKFASAEHLLDSDGCDPTAEQRQTVETLAQLFGNSGWFDGLVGQLVAVAVTSVIRAEFRGPAPAVREANTPEVRHAIANAIRDQFPDEPFRAGLATGRVFLILDRASAGAPLPDPDQPEPPTPVPPPGVAVRRAVVATVPPPDGYDTPAWWRSEDPQPVWPYWMSSTGDRVYAAGNGRLVFQDEHHDRTNGEPDTLRLLAALTWHHPAGPHAITVDGDPVPSQVVPIPDPDGTTGGVGPYWLARRSHHDSIVVHASMDPSEHWAAAAAHLAAALWVRDHGTPA